MNLTIKTPFYSLVELTDHHLLSMLTHFFIQLTSVDRGGEKEAVNILQGLKAFESELKDLHMSC